MMAMLCLLTKSSSPARPYARRFLSVMVLPSSSSRNGSTAITSTRMLRSQKPLAPGFSSSKWSESIWESRSVHFSVQCCFRSQFSRSALIVFRASVFHLDLSFGMVGIDSCVYLPQNYNALDNWGFSRKINSLGDIASWLNSGEGSRQ